jgi:hypothetical protein
VLRARAPVRGGSAQLRSRASTTPNDGNRVAHKIKSAKILLVADTSVGDGRLPGETAMLTEHDSLSHETVRRRPCRAAENKKPPRRDMWYVPRTSVLHRAGPTNFGRAWPTLMKESQSRCRTTYRSVIKSRPEPLSEV